MSKSSNHGIQGFLAFTVSLALSIVLTSCYSPPAQKQPTKQYSPPSAKVEKVRKTYSDIPTPYPGLYRFDPDSALKNIYDESRVISWEQAWDYVGQEVTVEGSLDSVVHAASTNGSPYFYNVGGGAYEGFAVVVWSEDLDRFDQFALRNEVEWSMSGQPMQTRLRASGVVELYNDRPQITARDGTQVAQWVNGGWYSHISDSSMDVLMDSLYQ